MVYADTILSTIRAVNCELEKALSTLVFASLPEKTNPEYGSELCRFQDDLESAIRITNPDVASVLITHHVKTSEPERGSYEGDAFKITLTFVDGSTTTRTIRLTLNSVCLVRETQENSKKAENIKALQDAIEHYIDQSPREDIPFSEQAMMCHFISTIDEMYNTEHGCMGEALFVKKMMNLLIPKVRVQLADQNTKDEVLENNLLLLKYFMCKHLAATYEAKI